MDASSFPLEAPSGHRTPQLGGGSDRFASANADYEDVVHSSRRRTLKERIKRHMAGHASSLPASLEGLRASSLRSLQPSSPSPLAEEGEMSSKRSRSAEPTTASMQTTPWPTPAFSPRQAPNTTSTIREESVLAAASALASLGVTSPPARTPASVSTNMNTAELASLAARSPTTAMASNRATAPASANAAIHSSLFGSGQFCGTIGRTSIDDLIPLSESRRELAALSSSATIRPPPIVGASDGDSSFRLRARSTPMAQRAAQMASQQLRLPQSGLLRSKGDEDAMDVETRLCRLNDEVEEMKRIALEAADREHSMMDDDDNDSSRPRGDGFGGVGPFAGPMLRTTSADSAAPSLASGGSFSALRNQNLGSAGGELTMLRNQSLGNDSNLSALRNAGLGGSNDLTVIGGGRPFASLLGSDVPLTFPQKLMEVLSNPEISDIVSWLPHGRGFIILQKRRFASEVMPLYFKHSKFTSFTRKLNRWGFARVSRGPEMGAYYHKYFRRGDYLLCMQMHCQSSNKSNKEGVENSKASPKEEEEAKSGTPPPPQIETSPGDSRDEAMSPLEENCSSPSPAVQPSSSNDADAPPLPMMNSGNFPKNRRLSPISEGCATPSGRPRNPGSFDKAFARQQEILRGAQSPAFRTAPNQAQERSTMSPSTSSSSLQQQQKLQELQQQQRRQHTQQQAQQLNSFQGGSTSNPPSLEQLQRLQRSLLSSPGVPTGRSPTNQLQQQPQNHQCRPRARSSANQALAVQRLLGLNTASSQSHSLVIAEALRALRTQEEGSSPAVPSSGESNGAEGAFASAHAEAESAQQARHRVLAAMRAQMRQLEGPRVGPQQGTNVLPAGTVQDTVQSALLAQMRQLNAGTQRSAPVLDVGPISGSQPSAALSASTPPSRFSGGSLEGATTGAYPLGERDAHTAMLDKMRRLDRELKAQQAIIARGMGDGGGAAEASPPKIGDAANLLSQRGVARLYHEINAGRLQQRGQYGASDRHVAAGDVSRRPEGAGEHRSNYVRAVRRASAA